MRSFITSSRLPLNILLIEDDDGDAQALQRAFQKASISNTITRAVDGVEAMDALRGTNGRQLSAAPVILLLDLNMPRMNGIEFLKSLRKDPVLHSSIVFVLTTSNREEDRVAAYDLNVAGYITKARAAEDFLNLVKLIGIYDRIVEFP